MKALVYLGPGAKAIEDRPKPELRLPVTPSFVHIDRGIRRR